MYMVVSCMDDLAFQRVLNLRLFNELGRHIEIAAEDETHAVDFNMLTNRCQKLGVAGAESFAAPPITRVCDELSEPRHLNQPCHQPVLDNNMPS